MKKITSFAIAMAILLGAVACDKGGNTDEPKQGGTGDLRITFNSINDVETRAATANAKPITSWSKSIKSMMLLVVNSSGMIIDVRDIALESGTGHQAVNRTFNNVVADAANPYSIYILANYGETTTPFATGVGLSANKAITAATLKNQNINTVFFKLLTATGVVGSGDADNSVFYKEPAELFVAYQSGITVRPDETTTVPTAFSLTRAVSMMRVRIDQTYDPTDVNAYDNSGVIFNVDGKSNFRVRRHADTYTVLGNVYTPAPAIAVTNVLYSGKRFKTSADFVAADYVSGTTMGLGTDFTLYNEYLIFPGGNNETEANGDKKFDIVIGGEAQNGYVALTKDGTKTITTPEIVYWGGQVKGVVAANGILELNVKLKGQGSTVVPGVNDYGTLKIDVDLIEWGTITSVPVEF